MQIKKVWNRASESNWLIQLIIQSTLLFLVVKKNNLQWQYSNKAYNAYKSPEASKKKKISSIFLDMIKIVFSPLLIT